jgi:hypothetical protein
MQGDSNQVQNESSEVEYDFAPLIPAVEVVKRKQIKSWGNQVRVEQVVEKIVPLKCWGKFFTLNCGRLLMTFSSTRRNTKLSETQPLANCPLYKDLQERVRRSSD